MATPLIPHLVDTPVYSINVNDESCQPADNGGYCTNTNFPQPVDMREYNSEHINIVCCKEQKLHRDAENNIVMSVAPTEYIADNDIPPI